MFRLPLPLSPHPSTGLWMMAWKRLCTDRLAMASLTIVLMFFAMLALSMNGLIASDWDDEVGVNYAPPSFIGAQAAGDRDTAEATAPLSEAPPENPVDPLRDVIRKLRADMAAEHASADSSTEDYGIPDPLEKELAEIRSANAAVVVAAIPKQATLPFGADKWGHDIVKKTIKGAETSIVVGLIAAFVATFLGTVFGAFSGYFGGRVDDFFNWFYSIFTSIPYLLLILAVAAVLQQKGLTTIILILGLTGWTGVFRLVRAEYMKHKEREYVLAADAIGASHIGRMFVHIFPNISHVALVQMSLLVVGFIKSEVILSFLGFGVPVGVVSWGSMLNEAQNELILGKWWQLTAATAAMALLVTAFSLFTDALRDALDPKLK
ncbi:MAG: ABC transporter permease [Burkholderiaceae bacterium]|nr:ABC transporter permease [Burkholderiaceae bacterium]